MTTPTPSIFPYAADAVDAQQARQDRLHELYAQDGRQSPDFVFFTLKLSGGKIAIRKSSISAFYCACSGETILEYDKDSAFVRESFDEACAKLGIALPHPQQEPQP